MYNAGIIAYRNLPTKKQSAPVRKSTGLLSRAEMRPKPAENQSQLDKIAEYVSQIRKEREKLKNGRT